MMQSTKCQECIACQDLNISECLYDDQRENAGDDIIQHDPQAAVDVPVEPGHGPGFQRIEQPEKDKAELTSPIPQKAGSVADNK